MRRTSERALVVGGLAACAAAALLLITASLPLVLAAMRGARPVHRVDQRGDHHADPAPHARPLIGRVDAALSFAIVVPQAASVALGAALIAVVDYRILLPAMAADRNRRGYLAAGPAPPGARVTGNRGHAGR